MTLIGRLLGYASTSTMNSVYVIYHSSIVEKSSYKEVKFLEESYEAIFI